MIRQCMKSYHVHKVPDTARHLSACPPRHRQYPSSLRGLTGKKSFHVFKDWGLSSCVEAHELMRFHQDGRPALIVMKGHKPWIMYDGAEHEAHIYGLFRSHHWVVEDFSGALILLFIGQPDFAGPSLHHPFCQSSRFWQNLKVLHNPY